MRAALRLLASAQRSTQFLEVGAPTGLTGIVTHASPRSTLLYLYHSTLETLQQFPEHSVYRQSVEALTKHRMSIVEATRPPGLEEWQQRVSAVVDQNPEAFRKIPSINNTNEVNIVWKAGPPDTVKDDDYANSNVEYKGPTQSEGIATESERRYQGLMARDYTAEAAAIPRIEGEPSLTVEQINEIESKIGAGLIEEVINVAEGEKTLAETLYENKVWEDLEEKPAPGQWKYHERDTHTGETQAP